MAEKNCLSVIKSHASVRSYRGGEIPREHLEAILEAARRAPTGWNLQPLTIIAVQDPDLKKKLSQALGGQEHVAEAPVFLVFAIDYAKIARLGEKLGYRIEPGLGNLVEALIDAGIASGWAAIAAETLGYGITFIALYENPCPVAEALGLPDLVVPAVGLTIGRPAEAPKPRPRQSLETLVDYNHYTGPEEKAEALRESLDTYAGRASRLFSYIFSPGGYYERASRNMAHCLREKGFKV